MDGPAASRSPRSQTADRGVPPALSPSQPPRSALGPWRGRLSLPGRAASLVPFRTGFPVPPPPSGLEAPSLPFPPFRGQRPECPLSSSLRAQGILSSSSVSPRAAPCYLFTAPPCGPGFSHPLLGFPVHTTAGTLRSPVLLGMGSPLFLPVLPGTPPPRGLCQSPSRCVFFFSLSPRVRGHLCGQISCLPSAPTTTETLPPPRHLVVATSCLLPFEGRWRLPLNSYLPPPPERRKTLGHPPVAGRLHLGQRGRGSGVTLRGN